MNRFQMRRDAKEFSADEGALGGNFRSFLGGSPSASAQAGFTADPLQLANASAEIRARQAALAGQTRRPAAPSAHHRANRPPQSSDHEANVSALREQIRQELAQLRGDLTQSIQKSAPAKLDDELSSLRGELAQIRNMVASHGRNPQQEQWQKLSRSLDSLNAHPAAAKTDIAALREELAEMRALVATTAREDSVRQLAGTYADLAQRVDRNTAAAQDNAAREALARLIAQVDATQASIESLPSTRHLSNVEARIEGLGSSLEKVLGSRAELDSNLLTALEARLGQINDAVLRLDANAHSMPDEQAVVLQRLEQRIANLSQQVEAATPAADAAVGHHADMIAHRLDEMAGRLDRLAEAPAQNDALETILGQIGALQHKLDESSPRNMLPTLEQRLDSINTGLDRMAARPIEPDFSNIEAQMQRISAQIDGLAPRDMSQDISNIEASVRAMHDKLDTMPDSGPFDELTGNRLERQIAELASQLEQTAAPQPPSAARLNELEGQIANISQLLAQTSEQAQAMNEAMVPAMAHASSVGGGDSEAITARFDALEAHLANQQISLLDAARQVANEVVAQQGSNGANNELLLKLTQDLDRLHETAAQTNDGTRQTFDAVHTTLEKIVERLEQLELGVGQRPARTEAPAELAMAGAGESHSLLKAYETAPEPQMPKAAPFEPYEELPQVHAPGVESELPGGTDMPLEPGQLPQFGAPTDDTPLPPSSGNDGMDFIAAARRAARAAADEAAPDFAPEPLAGSKPDKGAKKLKRKSKAKSDSEGGSGSRLKRPIILASAAVILALATMKLAPAVTGLLSSEPEVASVEIEPSAAMQDVAQATQNSDNGVDAPEQAARVIAMDAQPSAASTPELDTMAAPAPTEPMAAPIVAPEVADDVGNVALRDAARSGNPAAMFEIALRYTEGRVVDKDSQAAFRWYQQAAEAGLAPAQFRLANFLEKGLGTEQDYESAVMWYQRAVEAGNARAMHNLAVLHTEEVAGGQKVDEATRLFRDAAELGVRDSQFNLGIMYGRGLGVELDLAESYKWFALAARAGDTEAAERRDQVANAMLPEDLDKARIAAQAWQAKPLIEDANTVNIPAEWSADTPGATASGANALTGPGGTSPETTGGIAIDSGNVGRDVQNALLSLGYSIGTADGIIGPKTVSAIRDFERQMGLPETGQPSASLLQAMVSVSSNLQR